MVLPKTYAIKNYSNYVITIDGRVWSKIRRRWLRPAPNKKGYLTVALSKDGKAKTLPIHRLVLETFTGPRLGKMECRHLDGNRQNNHCGNLVWGTSKENAADMVQHGTQANGEKINNTKLTRMDVLNIRRYWESGYYTQRELANAFDVDQTNISCIIRRKTWKHI